MAQPVQENYDLKIKGMELLKFQVTKCTTRKSLLQAIEKCFELLELDLPNQIYG